MDIHNFRTLHSGRHFVEETLSNAKRQAASIPDMFYYAALYQQANRLLPELLRLQSEQQAKVDGMAKQIQSLEGELDKFSDRTWLQKIFNSQAEEDKHKEEITNELVSLNTLYGQERSVLPELHEAIVSLSGVAMPELPSWLVEYLRQEA